MVRIALALYLVLSTAVGPLLCCCLPGSVFPFCSSATQSCAAHHRCGHNAANHRHQSAKTKEVLGQPSPARQDNCPCRKGQADQVLFAENERSSSATHLRSSLIPQITDGNLFLQPSEPSGLDIQTQPPSQCIAFPFCTSRDMLRALCIMRC
jgi:hypothetical protein